MALHKTNKTAHVLNLLATGEPEPENTENKADKPSGAASLGRTPAGHSEPAPAAPKQSGSQGLAPNISIVKTEDGADPLADLIRASLSKEILRETGPETEKPAAAPEKPKTAKGGSKKAKAFEPLEEETPDEEDEYEDEGEADEAPAPPSKKAPAKAPVKKTGAKKKAQAKAAAEPEATADEDEEEEEAPASKARKTKKAPAKRAASTKAAPPSEPEEDEVAEPEEMEDEETAATADDGSSPDSAPSMDIPPAAHGGLAFEEAMAAAENSAQRAHAHGYPGDSPEAAFFSSTAPTEDSYCYVNMMEMIVDDRLLEFMNRFGLCTCDRCVLDTKALALANLPPKYIVAPIESLPPLLSFYENKYSLNVITELTKACLAVLDNPRH